MPTRIVPFIGRALLYLCFCGGRSKQTYSARPHGGETGVNDSENSGETARVV